MTERLSFHIKRDSPLHRLNPLTKLTLTFALILVSFTAPWYWTATFVFLFIVIPLSFVAKVTREFFLVTARLIIPTATFLFIMQALFQPIGEHIVFKFYFLDVTQESLLYAYKNAARIIVMVSAFTLFLLTTHPSDLMSDLTRRGLPGQFAYVIISTLQIIPQMQNKVQTIIAAQRSRGLDTESSFAKRAGSILPLIGPLVFGSLVEVQERAIAIEARGFTSKKEKTFLHEIQDPSIEKTLRWALILLIFISIILNLWLS